MPTSIFLARLIGPIFLAGSVGILVNAAVHRSVIDEFLRSRALIYLSGLLTMTAGVALVLAHNVWVADWRVLITILGWLGAVGGAFRIIWPQQVEAVGKWLLRRPAALPVGAVGWFALGLVFCFFGYFR